MTISPPGAKLAAFDLPPPPPSADPREPETTRRSRTPQRAKSPLSSRASSPTRAGSTSPPPLLAPKPRTAALGTIASTPGQQQQAQGCTSPATSAAAKAALSHSHGHHYSHGHYSRPSSPSSIHSSASAIFERDIELPAVASLSLNPSAPTLNHKGSRIFHPHGSNLEHSVPAVLDDAVEALHAGEPIDVLEIEAPATGTNMGRPSSVSLSPALRPRVTSMSMPSGSGASRSPSPEARSMGSGPGSPASVPFSLATALASSPTSDNRSPISPLSMNSAFSPVTETLSPVSPGGSKHRPAPLRQLSSGPQLPGGWAFDEDNQGATAAKVDTSVPAPALPSHLTPTKDKRRISFVSYNDILLSVPTTVTSLNEITSGNLSPDHLPGTVSPTVPVTRSPALANNTTIPTTLSSLSPIEGEWQREGLGRGLEQRLEDLITNGEQRA